MNLFFREWRIALLIKAYEPFLSPSSRVLDVGIGDGIVADRLRSRYDLNVVGVDTLEYLLPPLRERMQFVRIEENVPLPFAAESFDVAMMNDVLHHLPYERQLPLLRECLRVANRVLVNEVEPTFSAHLVDYVLNVLHNPFMKVPRAFRTQAEWRRICESESLVLSAIPLTRPWYYPLRPIAFQVTEPLT